MITVPILSTILSAKLINVSLDNLISEEFIFFFTGNA